MTTTNVDSRQDVLDSRDVIARIAELEEYRDAAIDHLADIKERIAVLEAQEELSIDEAEELARKQDAIWTAEDGTKYGESCDWDEETEREWKTLKSLAEQAEDCGDWQYGETLIRDSYFEDYARQLADDLGLLANCDKWPATCIDWEQAAIELQVDYTSVEYEGVTYWIRS